MIWQHPWAWLGALTIAAPIVIHLLGRRRPRPLPFPTLRFLGVSTVTPARRHRLTDIALLCVRIAILLAGTAALAGPWLAGVHRGTGAAVRSHAIVVDASASMSRKTPDGRPASEAARDRARTLSGDGGVARVFEVADPAAGVAAAADWLAEQAPPRDVTVISDFQRGGVNRDDFVLVPADAGIHIDAIVIAQPAETIEGLPARGVAGVAVPHVRVDRDSTSVTWTRGSVTPLPLSIHASADDRNAVAAAIDAASVEGILLSDRLGQIDIVLPGATDVVPAGSSSRAIDEPWMFDVVAGLHRDGTIAALATSPAGSITARAGTPDARGGRLVLDVQTRADDVFLAAVIVGVARAAAGDAARWRELEPGTYSADELRTWERPPSPAPPVPAAGQSDGRWLWALALVLLGAEWWLRRSTVRHPEVAHARVA